MNEILAILAVVFDTERMPDSSSQDWEQMADEEIAENHLIDFLFDPKYAISDIYTSFDQILQLGIKFLYMDTKDITILINERKKKNTEEEKKKRELFEFDVGKEKEQAKMRRELEQAYEREKSKVSQSRIISYALTLKYSRW